MDRILISISLILYFAAATTLLLRLKSSIGSRVKTKIIAEVLGLVAIPLHGLALYEMMAGTNGLNLSFFLVLSLTAWLTNLIVLVVAIWRPVENLGLLTLPFAVIVLILQLMSSTPTEVAVQVSAGLEFHITISILSYVLLSIAAFQAVLLAIQNHQLRSHKLRGFIQFLPPLESMESLLFEIIGLGYILLSISLLSGATYIENIVAQHLIHKTLLSISAWVVFAILIWGRWRFGWRGKTAVRWTISGFLVLMLAYFGSKMVQELILGRMPT